MKLLYNMDMFDEFNLGTERTERLPGIRLVIWIIWLKPELGIYEIMNIGGNAVYYGLCQQWVKTQ